MFWGDEFMQALELKIPPPVVVLLLAGLMWGLASISPSLDLTAPARVFAALMFALTGVGFSLAGVVSFRRARTTINPMKPETTSALVSSGVYRLTRNPMYVGMLFVLIGWGVLLASVWIVPGALAFILYMNRFQIAPEERVLSAMFGVTFDDYKARVRRWL